MLTEILIENTSHDIYLFEINRGNTKTMSGIFKFNKKDNRTRSLTSHVFIVNFEQISHIVLKLLLMSLNK